MKGGIWNIDWIVCDYTESYELKSLNFKYI